MNRSRSRMVMCVLCLGVVALLALAPSASADFQGPYECQNWSKTVLVGPLNVEINPDAGESPSIEFSYVAPKPWDTYYPRKAAFSATAASTGTITFDWEYYFFHSWFLVYAHLWVYADGPSGLTEKHLVDFFNLFYTGPQTFTGSASIDVTEGYEFGLTVGGRNYDSSQILEGTVTLTNFFFPFIPVLIDIKPGSYPNSINLGSHGLVPVAILSSDDFDATTVDPDTVMLAGAGVDLRGKSNKYMAHEEDVDGDGLVDLVCKVATANLDPGEFQDGYALLTGTTFAGTPIEGQDEITIVPPE